MPYKPAQNSAVSSGVKGFRRNPVTGVVSVVDRNNVARQLNVIGYNDIYANAVTNYRDTVANKPGAYSNPAWTEYKMLGYGNHSDPRYPNPIRANARRMYLNTTGGTVTINSSGSVSKNNGSYLTEDRKDFLLYIGDKQNTGTTPSPTNRMLWNLNVTFVDVTLASFTITWPPAMTTANGAADVLKLNTYRPKIICEGSNGLAFQRAGRMLAIECGNQSFPELLGNSTAGITITINSSGSGMRVNNVLQATVVLAGSADAGQTYLQVARFAGQTYRIAHHGTSLRVTGENKGAFWNSPTIAEYEYIEYVDGLNDRTTSNSFNSGQIYARPAEDRLRLLKTGSGEEYYSDSAPSFSPNVFNAMYDIHCIKPSQYCPADPRTISGTFNSASVFQLNHKGEFPGDDPYYDWEYESSFNTASTSRKEGLDIDYISDQTLLAQIRLGNKYGIWTFLNAFWSFQNYGYSIYGGSAAEQKIRKSEAQQKYIDFIMQRVAVVIDEFGYCPLMLGNESNLDQNLRGNLNGQNIFFADQANQSKQANVNAMMDFFNRIAGLLHDVYGEKVLVGPSIQMANAGQVNEIVAALNLGHGSNFDILFNNYYGHSTEDDPHITFNDFNPMAYYKSVRGNNKLNVMLSECGCGNKKIDVNDIPANYPPNGSNKNYTVTAPINYGSALEITRAEQVQASVDRNMVVKFLKDAALNDIIQGIFIFGDMDQPHRSSLEAGYGVATDDSFFNPPSTATGSTPAAQRADIRSWLGVYSAAIAANPTAAGSTLGIPRGKLAIFEERTSSHLWRDTPRQFNPNGNDYQATAFMPTLAQLQAAELPSMGALRAEIALGVPHLLYSNQI
jgi:hypothetical protein